MFVVHSGDLSALRVPHWLYFEDMQGRTGVNRWEDVYLQPEFGVEI